MIKILLGIFALLAFGPIIAVAGTFLGALGVTFLLIWLSGGRE